VVTVDVAALGLGVLIGFLSGAVALLMLWTAAEGDRGIAKMTQLGGEILAIAGFWFGGTWATGQVLGSIKWETALPSYISALVVVFGLIVIYPLIRLIIRVARILGGG
jgi:hypothetical protein